MGKRKLDGHRNTPANSAQDKELPTTHWAYAVAMIAEKNKAAALESKKQLPDDFSASDFDVVRARVLSSQV